MKTTLDELQAFTSVVDTGSITAAAMQLAQTVSGVSRTLSRLEQKLATTLLRRTTRRLELTEEGQAFLLHARHILGAIDAAEEQMARRRQAPAGRLRVNAASPFMLHAIVPLVPEFMRRYPQIELLERRTDIAIRIGPLADSSLHARPLGSNRLRVLASPGYLARHGRPLGLDDLASHTLLGFKQPESLNRWPLRGPQGDELAITPALTASSGETLRQLALQGVGIVCLADFMTGADRASGALLPLLESLSIDVRQPIHAVYYRNTQLAARITCFLDFLAERLNSAAAHAL